MNKNLPDLWNNILSTIDDKFLKSILEDIEHIEIGNMVATDIRIVFNKLESYNFFKIAIKNTSSSRKIEKIFSEAFGDNLSMIIDPPNSKE
ncbi:MAG: hypothetical protein GWO78_05905 [Dehalococcoidales bacterium]|jgi:hypothetical protein|nr:hypothetical protein [Dehalococcoidales bacterium]|tara:strand:+ start:652 stop:924 length:273 start_codon:yes stop_codon:yes gene_type:complete